MIIYLLIALCDGITHLYPGNSERSLDVRSHPERHFLRYAKGLSFLEANVVIDVDNLPGVQVNQHIVEMPVTETDNVPDDRHHGYRVGIVLGCLPPAAWVYAVAPYFSTFRTIKDCFNTGDFSILYHPHIGGGQISERYKNRWVTIPNF